VDVDVDFIYPDPSLSGICRLPLKKSKIAWLSGFWPLYSSQAQIDCNPALCGVSYSVPGTLASKEGRGGVTGRFRLGGIFILARCKEVTE
jgi:hypothetical protein